METKEENPKFKRRSVKTRDGRSHYTLIGLLIVTVSIVVTGAILPSAGLLDILEIGIQSLITLSNLALVLYEVNYTRN